MLSGESESRGIHESMNSFGAVFASDQLSGSSSTTNLGYTPMNLEPTSILHCLLRS
jgi:hypothetical protein